MKTNGEPAKNALNRYSTIRRGLEWKKMGLGYSFAQTMLETQTGISIGLVVNAKGSSTIEQWAKGTPFYQEALRRTQEAQHSGVIKGIL